MRPKPDLYTTKDNMGPFVDINWDTVTEASSDDAAFVCSTLLWTFSYSIPGITYSYGFS